MKSKSSNNTKVQFPSNSLSNKEKVRFSTIRSGGVVGIHEVMFIGNSDILSIKHQAMSRVIYAKGDLSVAEWLLSLKQAGLYSYLDLLNTKI